MAQPPAETKETPGGRPKPAPKPRQPRTHEPRWPAVLALLATGGLHFIIPAPLRFGQEWLLLVVVTALLIPTVVAHRAGKMLLNRALSHTAAAAVTASMVWSLALLILRLPRHLDPPAELLRAAAALWVANVLVFTLWYWRLDAGGPNQRDRRRIAGEQHAEGCFLFPQMAMSPEEREAHDMADWHPQFVDYLFLAFNTSTALSPTDTAVLGRMA